MNDNHFFLIYKKIYFIKNKVYKDNLVNKGISGNWSGGRVV